MSALDNLSPHQFAERIMNGPMTFHVKVGYSQGRPIVPDEHTRDVMVSANHETEAQLIAAQMVGAHNNIAMVTSTKIHGVKI